jgi:hypothetical protein
MNVMRRVRSYQVSMGTSGGAFLLHRVWLMTCSPTRRQALRAALSFLHNADLKPGNILINSRGVPKISDFGLARQHNGTTVVTGGCGRWPASL